MEGRRDLLLDRTRRPHGRCRDKIGDIQTHQGLGTEARVNIYDQGNLEVYSFRSTIVGSGICICYNPRVAGSVYLRVQFVRECPSVCEQRLGRGWSGAESHASRACTHKHGMTVTNKSAACICVVGFGLTSMV